jgi:hypothetical protein
MLEELLVGGRERKNTRNIPGSSSSELEPVPTLGILLPPFGLAVAATMENKRVRGRRIADVFILAVWGNVC